MSAGAKKLPDKPATLEDLFAIPEEEERHHEIIDGELVEKGAATGEHGGTQGERVRAEPFDAIELHVGVFFGDDEPEE